MVSTSGVGAGAGAAEDGGQARVAAALHIAREAVADHDGAGAVLLAELGEDLVEKFPVWLLAAHLLGDEHPVKIFRHAAVGDAAGLDVGTAVRHDADLIPLVQLPQDLLAVRHEIVLQAERVVIRLVARRG